MVQICANLFACVAQDSSSVLGKGLMLYGMEALSCLLGPDAEARARQGLEKWSVQTTLLLQAAP